MAVVFRPRRPLFTVNARIRTPQEVTLQNLNIAQQQIRLEDLEMDQERKQKFESGLQMINENPQWNADEKGMAYVKLQELYMPEEAVQSRMERGRRVDRLTIGTDVTTPQMRQTLDTWGELAVSRGSERAFKEIHKAVQQNNLRVGVIGRAGFKTTDSQRQENAAARVGTVIEHVKNKYGILISPVSMTQTDQNYIQKYAREAGIKNIEKDLIFLASGGDRFTSRMEEATIPLREVQTQTPARNRFEQYVSDAQYNREDVLDEYKQRISQLDVSMLPGWFATSKESDIKNFFEGDAGEINKLQKDNPELYSILMQMYLLITGQYEEYAQSRLNMEQNVGGFINTRINDIQTGNTKPKL